MEKEKIWTTPELIVLARSNPEEAVLKGCKLKGIKDGPNANDCWNSSTQTNAPCMGHEKS